MSGIFTRNMYDNCAFQQDVKQSTGPLGLTMDLNKYINCENNCKSPTDYSKDQVSRVDTESSLRGMDKIASKCDIAKHPFCAMNGCLLTNDVRAPPNITPYIYERGYTGENALVTSNMKRPTNPGYTLPNQNVCNVQNNGYHINNCNAPQPLRTNFN